MLLYVVAFLSGLMFIETVHSKPSKGRLPLINNLKAPLVAEIDVASINKELKEYIDNDITDGQNASSTRVEQLIAKLSTEMRETYHEKAKELFILQKKAEIEKTKLESDILKDLQPKSNNRIDSKLENIDKNLTAKFVEFQKQAENEIEILVNEKINAKLDQMKEHMEAQMKKFTNRLDIINATTIRLRGDCFALKELNEGKSGVYTINPRNGTEIKVYCNMEVDDGGWTVIQRRVDGTTDFYRGWQEYKAGFGDLEKNFWLGNEKLHLLTSNGRYELRVDLSDWEGNKWYAVYKTFSVGSESTQYKLTVGEYSGTAGDSLAYHNSQKFSTKDRENDSDKSRDCAVLAKGGWWYNNCHISNLNGVYWKGNHVAYDLVSWSGPKGDYRSLKFSRMMIRRY